MRFNEFKLNEDIYDDLMAVVNLNKQNAPAASAKPGEAPATGKAPAIGAQTKQRNAVSPADVKAYLRGKGLDTNQVAGIMANIQHESNFDSGAIGDNGTSGGLFQHHAERFANMVAASGGNNRWQANWQKQIDFALTEPAGKQYAGMRFRNPQEATKWWTVNFEIPQNKFAQANIRSRSATAYV